jgi:type IV pilus assembly protein PilE
MKYSSGFSMIELLITVSIIGILSSLALVSYGDNVIAANRTEGRSALQTAAGTLEKCRSLYGSYNHANCNYADFTTESNFYEVTADGNILASSFTLTATPIAGEPQARDADCTTLTLTNTGLKGGTGADPGECW